MAPCEGNALVAFCSDFAKCGRFHAPLAIARAGDGWQCCSLPSISDVFVGPFAD